MSTRSVIARPTATGFAGRYHHFDGYPSGLGAALVELYQQEFDRDLERMLKTLLDDHTGWSSVIGADFSMEPGFREYGTNGTCVCGEKKDDHLCQTHGPQFHADKGLPYPCGINYAFHFGHAFEADEASKRQAAIEANRPHCYCHGDRAEEGWLVTEENAAGSGCEWAYVLKDTPDGAFMLVLSSYTEITGQREKMIGFFGMGDENAEWSPVAIVGLDRDASTIDWAKIENGEPLMEAVG